MIEISYADAGIYTFLVFVAGIVYEHIASKFNYKTGKYEG